ADFHSHSQTPQQGYQTTPVRISGRSGQFNFNRCALRHGFNGRPVAVTRISLKQPSSSQQVLKE
ncbi:hypothetical protein P7S38_005507, partial [Klebsiella variicola]